MGYDKPYLKSFIHYCKFEDALKEKRRANQHKINYHRVMLGLEEQRKVSYVNANYEENLTKAKKLLSQATYFHNTSISSIVSILEKGSLLSISEMEKVEIPFNYTISYRGINPDLHRYVFVYPKGEWIYGLCQIEFKKDIERLDNSLFLPKSSLRIPEEELNNFIMEFSHWKNYLQEFIAINIENPSDYFSVTPAYNRPEFLIPNEVSVDLIEKITCKGKSTYDYLCKKIKAKLGVDTQFLDIIDYIV